MSQPQCMHAFMRACVCACVYVSVYEVCMHACMRLCMDAFSHRSMHTFGQVAVTASGGIAGVNHAAHLGALHPKPQARIPHPETPFHADNPAHLTFTHTLTFTPTRAHAHARVHAQAARPPGWRSCSSSGFSSAFSKHPSPPPLPGNSEARMLHPYFPWNPNEG